MLQIKSFVFSPLQENTYILYNKFKECVIIDPGCYYDDEKHQLADFINKNELVPKMLLNTHCHLDHVFGNKFIADTFRLSLHIHKKEEKLLQYAPASGLMYNLPFDNYKGELLYLEEGDTVMIGQDSLDVLLVPGHSPGSIAFYSKADGFIISGDTLFNRSIGRTDLPGGNHETLLKNIREKLFVLPGETKVYSGHGPETTINEEIRFNPFLQN